jgi:antitoxin CcdA
MSMYDIHAPRKATNVTVNADLLAQARELDVNLSAELDARLIEVIRQRRAQRWLEENAAAIEETNRLTEEHGTFGAQWRSF